MVGGGGGGIGLMELSMKTLGTLNYKEEEGKSVFFHSVIILIVLAWAIFYRSIILLIILARVVIICSLIILIVLARAVIVSSVDVLSLSF